jgi:DNA-binding CsgD family transcriptional regulator
MQFLFIEELLQLFFLHCSKSPELFVSKFDYSNFLIAYNYNRTNSRFTHVSYSFRKILGYNQNNILTNGNFASKIIHPNDVHILNEYLNIDPTSINNISHYSNQQIIKRTKCRAWHSKMYWKYFIIFSIDYWNSNTNTIDKIGLIADEHTKPHQQVISENRDHFHINTFISDRNLYSQGSNENNVMISPRESEILELISDGLIARVIATKLNICLSTVITHRKNLISKFHACIRYKTSTPHQQYPH